MVTCRWVQDRLLLYLAGEIDPRLAAKLCRHLERCGRCTRVAEELAETQEVLGNALEQAIATPATLHERVMDALRALPAPAPGLSVPTRSFSTARWGWPAFASAGLCLLAAGFLLGREQALNNHPPATPAVRSPAAPILSLALLAADHEKPLQVAQPDQVVGSDPWQVAHALAPRVAFPVTAVDLRNADARLLGGQAQRVQGVPVAFQRYDWRGERVSLFQMDGRKIALPGLRETTFDGHCFLIGEREGLGYVLWCKGTTNFVLVARATPEQLLRLASAAGGASTRG